MRTVKYQGVCPDFVGLSDVNIAIFWIQVQLVGASARIVESVAELLGHGEAAHQALEQMAAVWMTGGAKHLARAPRGRGDRSDTQPTTSRCPKRGEFG